MKSLLKSLLSSLFILALISGTNKASAQYSSSLFQGAKSSGKGNAEMTAHYSNIGYSYDGESGKLFNNFGFQAGYGISNLTEIRIRYDRMNTPNSERYNDYGVNGLMFGPKFSTNSGKFAVYLPFGFNFGDEVEKIWLVDPTLIFSLPLGEKVSLNLSPSYLFSLEELSSIDEGILKLNIGFGINLGESWVIRPEGGLQYFVSDFDGNFYNFGLGVSRKLGKNE